MASEDEQLRSVHSVTFDSQRTARRDAPADGVLGEGALVGSYVVRRRLGSGAMGAVYAAWDPRLEREVALKVLHLDGDLLAEARLLAKLTHPNVVAVHEVFSWGGRAVLVMELVHGETLHEWLPRHPLRERLAVLQQCAAGLEAAHGAGIVHRDFKPANVLVDGAGRARLVDFGLALQGRAGHGLAGSPAYMPLAQLEGAPADPSSDQFGWWVTVYEALAGHVPHDAPTLEGLIAARREASLDLAKIPIWLRPALQRGLSNARFPSMRAAAQALVPPRRAWLVAVAAALMAGVVFAWPTHSTCDDLLVKPEALALRARAPALVQAVADYAAAQTACRALPKQSQPERSGCLDVVGRELDVALEAVDLPEFSDTLAARVLKRVRPAARCEKPSPPAWTPEPDRAGIVESLRAQLRFDALREKGDFEGAAKFASEHVKATANASVRIRAWAGFNEASAWSTAWQGEKTTKRLRELELLSGLGAREQAWISTGRWLFECFSSSHQHCRVAQAQAQRAVAVLDEPWANAFMLEVRTLASDEPPPVRTLIDAWRAIPGAEFEVQRALGNELSGALVSGDLVRRRAALAISREIEPTNLRSRQSQLSLEVAVAIDEADLAGAAAALARLDALDGAGPDLERARFDARWASLVARGDSRGALDLLARWPSTDPRLRVRRRIIEFSELTQLGDPAAKQRFEQLELIEDELQEGDRAFYLAALVRYALKTGDAALLAELEGDPNEAQLRAWQLAVLKNDVTAERALYEAARGQNDQVSGWLLMEEALQAGRFADVVERAPTLRGHTRSRHVEQQLRLAEAWARWQQGEREVPCQLVTMTVRLVAATPRQLERLEALRRGCPFLGRTPWPAPR
ncbi:MAG: serine/threonine-protein kinase [Archangium sp.]